MRKIFAGSPTLPWKIALVRPAPMFTPKAVRTSGS